MTNLKRVTVLRSVWTSEGKLLPGEHQISAEDYTAIDALDKESGQKRIEAVKRKARKEKVN